MAGTDGHGRNQVTAQTTDFIGMVAGSLTTLSFVPQVWKTYRRKSAGDFSWAYLLAFTAGLALWLWYGLLISSMPVILANAVALFLLAALVGLKVKYR
jgi:MtN3 and saliva related transmembrane protein